MHFDHRMIVSSLEYCAKVTASRLLVDDSVGRYILQRQIDSDAKFHVLLESILAELVRNGAGMVTDELLALLLSGRMHMKQLTLQGCANVTIKGFSAAVYNQPHIELLDISQCSKLAVSSLGDICALHFTHLKTLSFESCESLTDDIVKEVMTKCLQLSNLNISCNQLLTDQLFDFSDKDARNFDICQLSRIDVSGCQGISSTSVRHMLSLFGSTLKSVNISWTKIDCTALVYLSGYGLSSAVYIATNSRDEMPFSVAELEASQEFEFQVTKRQSCDKIQMSSIPSLRTISSERTFKSSSPSTSGLLPTEDNRYLGNTGINLNSICEKETRVGQQVSFKDHIAIENRETDKSDSAEEGPEHVCRKVAKVSNKYGHCIKEKTDCFVCNKLKKWGLKRAHSYSCIDEHDMTVYGTNVEDIFTNFRNNRLSRSSCNLQLVPIHQKELSDFFPLPMHGFMRQDFNASSFTSLHSNRFPIWHDQQNASNCNDQDAFIVSPCGTVLSETKSVNGKHADSAVPAAIAADRDTDVNAAEVGVLFGDRDYNGEVSKEVQNIYDSTQVFSVSADSTDLAQNDEVASLNSTGTLDLDKQHVSKSCSNEVACFAIDGQTSDEMKTMSEGNISGSSNCQLEKLEIVDTIASLLSSQAELYKPRQMFISHITELDISQIRFYDVDVGIKCLTMFVTSNHHLEALSISWQGLTDSMLEIIVKNEPNLVRISLAECECLSNSGIISLGKYCKRLVDLDLQGVPFISDKGLVEVLAHGLLRALSLAECAITDLTLKNIAKFCSASIKDLNFSWCENISNEGLIRLIEACSALESLNLRQCEVSAQAVEAITCFGGNISYLGLCSIQDLTDKLSCPLVQRLKDLTFIDLSWNCLLTDKAVSTLFTSCRMLREAVLAGLKRISSRPLLPIISSLQEWNTTRECIRNRLRKEGNLNVRDIGAQEVFDAAFYLPYRSLHYAPNLGKLDLSFSDKVNDTHLAEIVSVCRGTLAIDDYFSMPIKPRWTASKQ